MLRVLLAITTLITFAVPVFAGETRRWNVLWISAEDLSPDLGCYGDEYASTPNLDLLASQGVRYDLAFASAPVCSPSRSSIITGMYAPSIGTHHHRSNVQVPDRLQLSSAAGCVG
jgi:N-sulfoglucosamine sulfohydrolase